MKAMNNKSKGLEMKRPFNKKLPNVKAYAVQFNLGCEKIYIRFELLSPIDDLERFKEVIRKAQYLAEMPYLTKGLFIDLITFEFARHGFDRVQK